MEINIEKARQIALILYNSFRKGEIFGINIMPEDLIPDGINRGGYEHLIYITLTVSIDYQRSANLLWKAANRTYQDHATSYLFSPARVINTGINDIIKDMQKYSLSKKPQKDATIWKNICKTLHQHWNANPFNFIEDCGWNSLNILARLKYDHSLTDGKIEYHFPYLRGDKIGPLWIRMIRDNVGCDQLTKLDKVPIPVDIHIARASLVLGVVRGKYSGNINGLFNEIRAAWFAGASDHNIENRNMVAVDVDEPLWNLSKYGCSKRKPNGDCPKREGCSFSQYCIAGRIKIKKDIIEINT